MDEHARTPYVPGRILDARFARASDDRGTRAGFSRALSTDAQFASAWAHYELRNAGAKYAEPIYGKCTRVYISGRTIAHLTTSGPDDAIEPLCGLRASKPWRGMEPRSEARAVEMRMCHVCRVRAEELAINARSGAASKDEQREIR